LILSVVAALILIIALGPNLTVPGPVGDPRKGARSSPLFFLLIAEMTDSAWERLWRPGYPTLTQMVDVYTRESRNIASKTTFKYGRTNEARAVFTIALFFLASSIAIVVSAFSDPAGSTPDLILWGDVAIWLALIGATFAFLLVYDFMRLEQEIRAYETEGLRIQRIWPLHLLAPLAATFVFLMLLAPTEPSLWWYVGIVTVLAVGLVALQLWPGPEEASLFWRGSVSAGAALAGFAGLWALCSSNELNRYWAVVLFLALLESPRFSISVRTVWRRTRLAPMASLGSELKRGLRPIR
jgi:hypothetical protein